MDNDSKKDEMFEGPVEINLMDYGLIIWKRKWLITILALATLAIAAYKTYSTIPRYTARGTIIIEREDPNILSFEQVFQMPSSWEDDFYQTQYKVLQSKALAEKVAQRLGLGVTMTAQNGARTEGSPTSASTRRRSMISSIQGKIRVSPMKGTRIVEVGFSDPDPKFAADAVNAISDAFIEMNIEARYAATEQATQFLTKQTGILQSEIDGMEKQLQAYGVEKNIVSLGGKETTVGDKLAEMNKSLTEAQIDTAKKQAYYNAIKNASPDYFPETLSNPLIQKRREDYVALNREYQKKLETYRPEYPEMQRLKSEMDGAKKALETETQNLIRTAESDYQAALRRERSLEDVFNRQRNTAALQDSNSISYNSLKAQIDSKRNLLDSLMKRQSETGVSAQLKGLGASNIKILDRAEVPLRPSSPNRNRDMLIGFLVGLMGGVGLAFFLHFVDNSVKTAEDVEKYAKLPALGIVPVFEHSGRKGRELRKGLPMSSLQSLPGTPSGSDANEEQLPDVLSMDLITHFSPKSSFAESYRAIRTALLLSSTEDHPKTFVVTSPLPSEGKTATISNLAVTLTQAGKRVVIIDADLRKPRQHKIFNIKNINGLTNYLTSNIELRSILKETPIPLLSLINAGPVPPNPSELLGSEKMAGLLARLKDGFDYIFVDTPPILAVTDAIVLAPRTDGMILIIWGGKTPREALKRVKEKLDLMRIKSIGVILNRVNLEENSYYYKHHYYYYGEDQK